MQAPDKVVITLTTVPDRLNYDVYDGFRSVIESLCTQNNANYEVHLNLPYVYLVTGEKYEMGIKFVPITEELVKFPEKYDYILCSEVLEHCWHPISVLKNLVAYLKEYGLIYISDFYNDCNGEDPSHLKHNNALQDVRMKFQLYADCGIEPYVYDVNGVLKIWKKY